MPQTSLLHSSIGDLKQGGQLIPTGTILAFAGTSSPTGWLVCDGTAYNQSDYSDLYSVLSTTYNTQVNPTTGSAWAAPTGTQFRVPDLRGLFLRGAGTPSGQSAVTVGGHQVQSTAKNSLSIGGGSHTHRVAIDASGSPVFMNQATGGSLSGNTFNEVGVGTGLRKILAWSSADGVDSSHSHSIAGDPETRPMNRGVTYIIKI